MQPDNSSAHNPAVNPRPDDEAGRRAGIERAFLVRAAREGLVAPDDALKLIGDSLFASPAASTLDGSQAWLDDVFRALRTSRPYLFAHTSSPGLSQLVTHRDPSDSLLEQARASGLTRDIQLWRDSRRRR